MPTYVYRFVDSGETIEVQQAFSDDPLTEAIHPGTGEVKAVKKVFTPVGVTFKGGGFYKTDSRGGSSRSSAAKTDGDGASTTKTESTSATPAASTPAASTTSSSTTTTSTSSSTSD